MQTLTGYKIYTKLKKVSNDVNEYPLDVNNVKITDSGLVQDTKNNVSTDPNYVAKAISADCA